jgi:heat-inducible transcriptional repressor
MLDDRKASILRAIVEEYIQTAQPVGSNTVMAAAHVQVSPATIRNDMVALEREGFLQQPHTSAGRVPTEKAYRFFVDHLERPGLAELEVEAVRAFFDRTHNRLEEMLHDTSRLLSNLTSYAAVVVAPPHEVATVRSVQFVSLDERVALLVVVLSNGAVERRTIDLGADTSEVQLNAAGARLSTQLVGATLSPPLPTAVPTGELEVDRLVDAAVDELQQGSAPSPVFVGGTSKMAAAFNAIETVRSVLSVLEEQYLVVTLIKDIVHRGLNVAIGTETGVAPLAECSLVVAPYLVEGQPGGSIGVLGPTRMNYPQALAAVAVVSSRLGDRLSKG